MICFTKKVYGSNPYSPAIYTSFSFYDGYLLFFLYVNVLLRGSVWAAGLERWAAIGGGGVAAGGGGVSGCVREEGAAMVHEERERKRYRGKSFILCLDWNSFNDPIFIVSSGLAHQKNYKSPYRFGLFFPSKTTLFSNKSQSYFPR